MKKILFVAHDPGGYEVIYPVYNEFQDNSAECHCVGPAGKMNAKLLISGERFLEHLLHRLKSNEIALLVTGTSWDSDIELRAIELCKSYQVKTVSILDYWSNYASRFLLESKGYVYPDTYIVMDELAKAESIMAGVPEKSLMVLGHPGLDELVLSGSQSKKKELNTCKALFLSQPLSSLYGDRLGYTEQLVLLDCLELFQTMDGWQLDVKFHPKDKEEWVIDNSRFQVEGNLRELVLQYDLIIGMSTMGLLHSVLLGVPAISYQPNLQEEDGCITNKLGLTPLITSKEDFRKAVHRFIQTESRSVVHHTDMEDFIWLDGLSTERVYSYLKGVAAGNEH
ncbi:hypothetical protein ASG89_29035 [Paenibacillus sp. Soil766]|uniref:hypothetical protein n=1 Tax=Paenibacillus sp. Soil766 TaxID=1736404 RepID=UPI000708A351|nr:hypothetical protein [Paenibacillus sp. Soil766]KRE97950.1 hypothetical protein ASG89_29035 [Paenibacillus sp. Soil766]